PPSPPTVGGADGSPPPSPGVQGRAPAGGVGVSPNNSPASPPPGGEERPTITAAVLARDEAAFIGPCLASLEWADALLVLVDDRTADATAAIARQHTEQ